MARAKNRREVGAVESRRLGLRVPIYYDVVTHHHHAEALGEAIEQESYATARTEVEALLKRAETLDWKPVIEVQVAGTQRRRDEVRADVDLYFERYFVARRHDGAWNKSDWKFTDTNPPDASDATIGAGRWREYVGFEAPHDVRTRCSCSHIYGATYDALPGPIERTSRLSDRGDEERCKIGLPYDEGTWASLVAIAAQIDKLRAALTALVSSAQGQKALASGRGLAELPATTQATSPSAVARKKGRAT